MLDIERGAMMMELVIVYHLMVFLGINAILGVYALAVFSGCFLLWAASDLGFKTCYFRDTLLRPPGVVYVAIIAISLYFYQSADIPLWRFFLLCFAVWIIAGFSAIFDRIKNG